MTGQLNEFTPCTLSHCLIVKIFPLCGFLWQWHLTRDVDMLFSGYLVAHRTALLLYSFSHLQFWEFLKCKTQKIIPHEMSYKPHEIRKPGGGEGVLGTSQCNL